jgi:4-hydroxybenzoate polyprenyltransferase
VTRWGALVALFWLARPGGTALLLCVPAMGYGMALWGYALMPWRPVDLLGVLVAWALLSAGTLWLNAALDGEEGGAVFAPRTGHPAGLRGWGMGALAAAVLVAIRADRRAGIACGICAVLAVLYSHPKTAWKGHPVLGPLVNVAGYGVLSPLAGWFVAEVPMDFRTAAAFGSLALTVLGSTFAAQAFQREDDARRGYRTLVVTHGPATCLRAAHGLMRVSVVLVGALSVVGYYPRLCLVGLPAFWLADRWMFRWRGKPGGGVPSDAVGLLVRMLLGAVVLVVLAYADLVYTLLTGDDPPGGAGTAAGRTSEILR